jgi:hypothetical protein
LPDSFVNEAGSHGLVSYYINRKMDIPLGTEIENTAYIYFDFNPPIVTNTTRNTLYDPTLGIQHVSSIQFGLQPNPTNDRSRVVLKLDEVSDVQLTVMDISGRLISSKNMGVLASGEHQWTLDSLPSGSYLIRIQAGNKVLTRRLVVTR